MDISHQNFAHGQDSLQRTTAARNPADNLTQQDRVRGGQRSAGQQIRGPKGQFAGSTAQRGRSAPADVTTDSADRRED